MREVCFRAWQVTSTAVILAWVISGFVFWVPGDDVRSFVIIMICVIGLVTFSIDIVFKFDFGNDKKPNKEHITHRCVDVKEVIMAMLGTHPDKNKYNYDSIVRIACVGRNLDHVKKMYEHLFVSEPCIPKSKIEDIYWMDKKNGIPNSVYLTNNVYVRFFYDPNYRPIRNEFELIWENDVSFVESLPQCTKYCNRCGGLIEYGSNQGIKDRLCAKCSQLPRHFPPQMEPVECLCNKCGKVFKGAGSTCFACLISSIPTGVCTMCGKDISKASSVEVGSIKCIECIMKTMAHMQDIIDRSIKKHSEEKQ